MKLLPVALRVEGAPILVVGGGTIATRKVLSLLECGACVTVVAPELGSGLQAVRSQFKYFERGFEAGDLESCSLVFACTNDAALNSHIAELAREKGLWCQVASDADRSTLHSAAVVRRDKICIGVTTGGGSPALSKLLREEIEKCIGPEYAQLLGWMDEQRGKLKEDLRTQSERAQLWRAVLESEVLSLLREGKEEEARDIYRSAIENLLGAQS